MQIGIDLGATKIEYVLLDNNNVELKRDRSMMAGGEELNKLEVELQEMNRSSAN